MGQYVSTIFSWLNDNQGVVTVAIFILTLLLGWFSGVFSALRRKPNFEVRLHKGPTFSCTFYNGGIYNKYETHCTGIALYLEIRNTGQAPSSIVSMRLGYHWSVRLSPILWIKYQIGWFWLNDSTVSLDDFQVKIGSKIKCYPFLFQKNSSSSTDPQTYLRIGETVSGVVYFEQHEGWGAAFPRAHNKKTQIKLKILDSFGGKHISYHKIPVVSLEEAQKYNPAFLTTLSQFEITDQYEDEKHE